MTVAVIFRDREAAFDEFEGGVGPKRDPLGQGGVKIRSRRMRVLRAVQMLSIKQWVMIRERLGLR